MLAVFKSIIGSLVLSVSTSMALPVLVRAERGSPAARERSAETSAKLESAKETARQKAEAAKEAAKQTVEAKKTEAILKACERFSVNTVGKDVDGDITKLGEKTSKRQDELSSKRADTDVKRNSERQSADGERQEHYAKMLEQATAENQKAAIAAFQEAVEKAVADRRAVQVAARETYRSGVDAAIASQKESIDEATLSYKTVVESALMAAQASCESGVDVSVVRKTLQDDLKSARELLKTSTNADKNLKEAIEQLIVERKASFETARTTFKTTLDEAKATLEVALRS
jgi:hypothetical protein